jgi:hypothetical protein
MANPRHVVVSDVSRISCAPGVIAVLSYHTLLPNQSEDMIAAPLRTADRFRDPLYTGGYGRGVSDGTTTDCFRAKKRLSELRLAQINVSVK